MCVTLFCSECPNAVLHVMLLVGEQLLQLHTVPEAQRLSPQELHTIITLVNGTYHKHTRGMPIAMHHVRRPAA